MRAFRYSFDRVPTSPLARFGLALLGLTILIVSFFVGLVFVAVVAGLAILGGLGLTIRNWLIGRKAASSDEDLIQVEYRVVRREQERDR
ncbi:MAG: hypothetical protein CVV18_02165 [Gammaproteobacteria bacterium HGW-Gammaproteobacteria-8]|nr:MAG: hypothetical protein CVV18_02165 [Gammaproteobacteria bacterium HGW-Gammaproteobacteria-8]